MQNYHLASGICWTYSTECCGNTLYISAKFRQKNFRTAVRSFATSVGFVWFSRNEPKSPACFSGRAWRLSHYVLASPRIAHARTCTCVCYGVNQRRKDAHYQVHYDFTAIDQSALYQVSCVSSILIPWIFSICTDQRILLW